MSPLLAWAQGICLHNACKAVAAPTQEVKAGGQGVLWPCRDPTSSRASEQPPTLPARAAPAPLPKASTRAPTTLRACVGSTQPGTEAVPLNERGIIPLLGK